MQGAQHQNRAGQTGGVGADMKKSRVQKSKVQKKTATAGRKPPEIKFYRSNEKPYGVFSNLYPSPIEFEGKLYPTAEHAYQAGKARRPEVRDWILSAPSPALAAMAAHGLYTWEVTPEWSQAKFERMRNVLRAKFEQHPELREILVGTGGARLVEAGRVDNAVNRLWGEVNGVGQNMLGIMLMELRTELLVPSEKKKRGKARKSGVGLADSNLNAA